MLLRVALVLALPTAAGCGTESRARAQPSYDEAADWTIGPVIRGRNYSHGMPLHPAPAARGGFQIDLPQAPASVHYVTIPTGSLAGKRRIVLRYRIEAAPGARIVPRNYPQWTAKITPYFQRRGDNWSGRGRFETYRWYATFASRPLTPGTHEIVAPLNANWSAVETSTARTGAAAFRAALEEAGEIGFVLGGGDGYGHGVFATGRARLIVTEFRVE